MTISTTSNSVTIAGNGATSVFSFPFVAGAAINIVVIFTDASGNETTLLSSQYTLFLNPPGTNAIWGIGGTVTYPIVGSPIAVGTTLTIERIVPLTQTTSISNQGDFYAQAVEAAMDILCMEIQQIGAVPLRSIQAPPVDLNPQMVLPAAAQRANLFVGFDNNGNVIAATPAGGTPVSAAMIPVVSALTLALSRAAYGFGIALTGPLTKEPTRTVLTTGSGTYTTPTGATRLNVRMPGGGGGGGAQATNSGTGGGNTTFGTALLVANGGWGGAAAGGIGGAGGTATGGDINITGGSGQAGIQDSAANVGAHGGSGAAGPFGGAGGGGVINNGGFAGSPNSGSGGGGGGGTGAGANSGAGGGAGGYCEKLIVTPLATYAYAVGAGGAGGAAGVQAGGAGGSGLIIIDEFYN